MTRRRAAVSLALALLVGTGVALLIGRAAGFARVVDSLDEAEAGWLALCLAGEIVSYAAYVAVFREVVRFDGGPELRRRAAAQVVFASLGAMRVIAASGAGALAVIYLALRRFGFARRDAAVRVLALNTLVFGVFGVAAWIAALTVAFGLGGSAPPSVTLPWLGLVAFCVAASLWVTAPVRRDTLSRIDGSPVRQAFGYAVAGTVLVRRLVAERQIRAVVATGVYWLGDMLCFWAALRAFDVALTPPDLVLAYATGYAATILPLPLGGVGGVDAALTYAAVGVGVPVASALLAVVAYRLFSFWLPTPLGLGALALFAHESSRTRNLIAD